MLGDRLLKARPGIIGGPGDHSGRSDYWVARSAREPRSPLLVPASSGPATQVIDARDLAAWLHDCAERGTTGTYKVGPAVSLGKWITLSREIGGHTGAVVRSDDDWLLGQKVLQAMGPESLALWVADAGFAVSAPAAAPQRRWPACAIARGQTCWRTPCAGNANRA